MGAFIDDWSRGSDVMKRCQINEAEATKAFDNGFFRKSSFHEDSPFGESLISEESVLLYFQNRVVFKYKTKTYRAAEDLKVKNEMKAKEDAKEKRIHDQLIVDIHALMVERKQLMQAI